MPEKILKYLSIASLAYIIMVILRSQITFNNEILTAVEKLVTVPVIMFIFGCFLFSIFKIMRRERAYIVTAIINAAAILFIMVFNIVH